MAKLNPLEQVITEKERVAAIEDTEIPGMVSKLPVALVDSPVSRINNEAPPMNISLTPPVDLNLSTSVSINHFTFSPAHIDASKARENTVTQQNEAAAQAREVAAQELEGGDPSPENCCDACCGIIGECIMSACIIL